MKLPPKALNLKEEEIIELRNKSKHVRVSKEEEEIVNKYTKFDAFLYSGLKFKKENLELRTKRMYQGKVEDYKFFVALYEKNNHSLSDQIKKYLKFSPCGQAKLNALNYRYAKNQPDTKTI
jgi:hypothetical protein